MQMSTKLLLFVTCFHFQSGCCCPSSRSETNIQPTKSTTVPLSQPTKSTTVPLSETSTSTSLTTMSMKMFISLNPYDSLNFFENGTRITRKLPDGELVKKPSRM